MSTLAEETLVKKRDSLHQNELDRVKQSENAYSKDFKDKAEIHISDIRRLFFVFLNSCPLQVHPRRHLRKPAQVRLPQGLRREKRATDAQEQEALPI